MSRIEQHIALPFDDKNKELIYALSEYLDRVAQQLNATSETQITGATNATTVAPTAGTYAQGDFIRNSEPVEAGSGGSMYIIIGFICVASGEPGTWHECRCLTGN